MTAISSSRERLAFDLGKILRRTATTVVLASLLLIAWSLPVQSLAIDPWDLVKGFLKSPNAKDAQDVPKGEGQIVKIDGRRCAVSRSEEGELNVCSAICTHMGCVVRWNGAEQTWDCPCHGSRFGTDGHVIAGPAETALERSNEAGRQRARASLVHSIRHAGDNPVMPWGIPR